MLTRACLCPLLTVAIYTNDESSRVRPVPVGTDLTFEGILAVAVIGIYASGLDVISMQLNLFQQTGEKLGAALSLDGADVRASSEGLSTVTSRLSARSNRESVSSAGPPSFSGMLYEEIFEVGHAANNMGDFVAAHTAFAAAYEKSGRAESGISAANMQLKLDRPFDAIEEYEALLKDGGLSQVESDFVEARLAKAREAVADPEKAEAARFEKYLRKDNAERALSPKGSPKILSTEMGRVNGSLPRLSLSQLKGDAPAAAEEELPPEAAGGAWSLCRCFASSPTELVAELGRCYLIFSEANGGSFMLQWSMAPVDGALASFVPREPAPQHRFKANGGLSELCRDVGGPNVKKFFGGWISYIKMARSQKGTLTFLGNVAKLPVAIYTNGSDLMVSSLPVGASLTFEGILGVAVLRASTSGFDVNTKLQARMFQQKGEQLGAAFALDGGGGSELASAVTAAKAVARLSSARSRTSSSRQSAEQAPASQPLEGLSVQLRKVNRPDVAPPSATPRTLLSNQEVANKPGVPYGENYAPAVIDSAVTTPSLLRARAADGLRV